MPDKPNYLDPDSKLGEILPGDVDILDDLEEGNLDLADLDQVMEAVGKRRKTQTPLWRLAADCGNPHVSKYLRDGLITFDRDFVARLRLREHGHIIRRVKKWLERASEEVDELDVKSPYAKKLDRRIQRVTSVLKALRNCRLGKPSGLTFSLLSRSRKEQKFYDGLWRVFSGTPDDHLQFETIVLAVLSGTAPEIVRQARNEMDKFRVLMNNFLRAAGKNRAERRRIIKMGWFEIEPYQVDHLLDVRRAYLDAKRAGRPIKKSLLKGYRKVRLMKRLGAKLMRVRGGSGTVWCLHYHAITNIEDKEPYVRRLKKLMPGRHRILVKRLYRPLGRAENFRRLAGYMLKGSPTYGRIDKPKTRGSRLVGDDLIKFVEIHAELGFRGMKANFSTSGK